MRITAVLVAVLFCSTACGGAPAPAPQCPAQPLAGDTGGERADEGRGAQESLLEYVPHDAMAAVIMRRNLLDSMLEFIRTDPQLDADLGRYIVDRLGFDLTDTEGLVGFAFDESIGLFLRIDDPGLPRGIVQEKVQGSGVTKLLVDDELYAARLPRGVIVGGREAVLKALAPPPAQEPASGIVATLRGIDDQAAAPLDLLGGVVDLDKALSEEGFKEMGVQLDRIVFSVDRERQIFAQIFGSRESLEKVKAIYEVFMAATLSELAQKKAASERTSETGEALGLIVGYHTLRRLKDSLVIEMQPGAMSASFSFQELPMQGNTGLLGVAAALAVPAFVGYVRRAKTEEAKDNLNRLYETLAGYHKRNKRRARRLHIEMTPEAVPCGDEPRPFSADDLKRWAKIGFVPEGKGLFAYEVGRPRDFQGDYGKAVLVLRAYGDLDCDGTRSTFELLLEEDEKGNLVRAQQFNILDETE